MNENTLNQNSVRTNSFEPPYLLVLFSLSIMRNKQGQRCVDSLWGRDLEEHVRYLKDLTIIASTSHEIPAEDATLIDDNPLFLNTKIIEVPEPKSTLAALKNSPLVARVIWRALKHTRVVHSSVASWPIPEAWFITPMLFFRKRWHLIIVESAFWRASPSETSLLKKIRANVHEFLNKRCLQRADLSIFTHAGYINSLLQKDQSRGQVISASWINESDILKPADLQQQIQIKQSQFNQPIKLVFAGRLNPDKGINFLINALADLITTGAHLSLDIYGDGVLRQACIDLIAMRGLSDHVRLCGMVNYGAEFYTRLKQYDVLIVPSLTDEQPRIVYDAYSQGLPVLASNTAGLKQCVVDGATGWLFDVGNTEDCKKKLTYIMSQRQQLAKMSEACVTYAHSMTHQEMHRRRLVLLQKLAPQF